MQRQALTPSEVGARVGLSGQTIRDEIRAGELRAFRTPKGHYRIAIKEAARYIARMMGAASPKTQDAPESRGSL